MKTGDTTMMRQFALYALLAGVSATALYLTTGDGQAAAPDDCREYQTHEPVLIYDVTGSTLLGPIHAHFTLYNDGFATYSSVSGYPTSVGDAWTASVTQLQIKVLLSELEDADVFQLCDQPMWVSDVPLKTITILDGGSDAYAHTFNYWLGHDKYAAPDAAIGSFIDSLAPVQEN
jgi:hypothetical protein